MASAKHEEQPGPGKRSHPSEIEPTNNKRARLPSISSMTLHPMYSHIRSLELCWTQIDPLVSIILGYVGQPIWALIRTVVRINEMESHVESKTVGLYRSRREAVTSGISEWCCMYDVAICDHMRDPVKQVEFDYDEGNVALENIGALIRKIYELYYDAESTISRLFILEILNNAPNVNLEAIWRSCLEWELYYNDYLEKDRDAEEYTRLGRNGQCHWSISESSLSLE
jgi:hypothetical protein